MQIKKLNKKFNFLSLLIVVLTYIFYSKTLSWGGYAGYILQAENAFGSNFYNFVEIQKVLYSYTEFQRDPIYTPIGLPILINIFSIIHFWNPLIIKILIPLSILIMLLFLNKITNFSKFNLLYLLIPINPGIVDEYRDTQTEIPGLMFFILGVNVKNKFLKVTLFLIATLIRPTLLIVIFIYYIFEFIEEKNYLGFFSYISIILSTHIILNKFYDIKFFGEYSNRGTKSSSLMQLYEHLITLDYERFKFIFSELGRLFIGFTNPINYLIGLVVFALLIIFRNKYSLMGLAYILFHFAWDAPYFVRYLLPVLIFFILGFIKFIKDKNINYMFFNIIFFTMLLGYTLQVGYQINNLGEQRGPYQEDSVQLFEYVVNSDYQLFSFHSPRVFRIFTKKAAYRLDTNLVDDTVIICEYSEYECDVPENYISKYKNNSFEVFGKDQNY